MRGARRPMWLAMVVWIVLATASGAVAAEPASRGRGGSGGDPSAEPIHLTSLCDGWRDGVSDGTNPHDLACDGAHGVPETVPDLAGPVLFSDCAGRGSWRPGNSHPCPSHSVGLAGSGALGTDVRFSTAAGGVVLSSDGTRAESFRIFLTTDDGEKYSNLPFAVGCPLPAGVGVTLQLRLDGVELYPTKGDKAQTRNGPVGVMSIGDVVLTLPDDPAAPHMVVDVSSCSS